MPDESNPISDLPTQTVPADGAIDADATRERSADEVLERNAGENSSGYRYMSTTERVRPERAPESLAEALADAPGRDASGIQPAMPQREEHDINPRASHEGPQPQDGEPATQRIGNRQR